MSRANVLVTADWAEQNLDAAGIGLRRGRRGHHRLRQRAHPRRRQARLEDRAAGPGPPRLRRQGRFEALLSAKGIGNDDTVILYGGNNNWFAAYAYWYFKLYGHERRQAARRRPQEVGARRPRRSTPTRSPTAPRPRTPRKEQDTSIRAFRDEVVAAIGDKNLVDVRSPDEFSGRLLAPAHLPQEQAQRAGHIPTALNVPWSQGRQRGRHLQVRRRAARALRARPGLDDVERPSPTAASASAARTPGSCCTSCSATRTSRTTTASWTEYGSLVGVPVVRGDERGSVRA